MAWFLLLDVASTSGGPHRTQHKQVLLSEVCRAERQRRWRTGCGVVSADDLHAQEGC
jgi:hypothetical protein